MSIKCLQISCALAAGLTCGVMTTGFFCRFGSTPALLGGMCGGRLPSFWFTVSRIDEGISSSKMLFPSAIEDMSAKRSKKVYCSRVLCCLNRIQSSYFKGAFQEWLFHNPQTLHKTFEDFHSNDDTKLKICRVFFVLRHSVSIWC